MSDPSSLDPDALRAVLREQLEIITGDADLIAAVRQAEAETGVIDLGQRARGKLEAEVRKLRATNEALIALAKANLAAQAQTHAAVLAVLEAETLAALDRKLTGRVPGALSVDVARVFIEGHAPLQSATSILGCSPDLVASLLGEHGERLGPVDTRFSDALYGPHGPSLRSEALARMEIGGHTGVLCLAARDASAFTPDQGADLIHFLARALERRIAPWLRR